MINEFSGLLEYLDKNKNLNNSKSPVKEISVLKEDKKNFDLKLDEEFKYNSSNFDLDKYKKISRESLIKNYINSNSFEKPYISVNEIISGCIRKSFFMRMKYKFEEDKVFKEPYIKLVNILKNKIAESIVNDYDFKEKEKIIISENFNIKDSVDALNNNIIFLIRVIQSKFFNGKYLDKHYYEGLVFSFILNEELGYKINEITIIYKFIDKIYSDPLSFDLKYDKKLAEKLIYKSKILLKAINNKIPPSLEYTDKNLCNDCHYSVHCKNDKLEPKIKKVQIKKEFNFKI